MTGQANPGSENAVVELEFEVSDPSHPFVGASEAEQCRFELQEMIPRGEGHYAEFFSVSGGDPDRILALADEHSTVTPRLLQKYEDGGLFEFSTGANCPAVTLAELGALPRTVRAIRGEGRIVGELPSHSDSVAVVEAFLETYPEAELVAKREKEYSAMTFNYDGFQQVVRDHLTDRQHEVLQAAYESGYYEWPRKCTGQEVADLLDITSATFSQHIHAAERKLLAVLFEGPVTNSWDGDRSEDS